MQWLDQNINQGKRPKCTQYLALTRIYSDDFAEILLCSYGIAQHRIPYVVNDT